MTALFLNNKYTKWYFNIIHNAIKQNRHKRKRTDKLFVYYEKHHMIPDRFYINNRSKGKKSGWLEGNANDPTNVVLLTAKEHIICHLLLTKMLEKDTLAHWVMCYAFSEFNRSNKHNRQHRIYSIGMMATIKETASKSRAGKPATGGNTKGVRKSNRKGKSLPPDAKQRQKGRKSPKKGIRPNDDVIAKMAPTQFKKGNIPWNKNKKGLPLSEKQIEANKNRRGKAPWNKGLKGIKSKPKSQQWKIKRSTKISKSNKTGIIGVFFNKGWGKNGTFVSYITIDKRRINLGGYKTLDEAKQARLDGELKYFGKYLQSI